MLDRTCAHCSKAFMVSACYVRRGPGHGRFCSIPCARTAQRRPPQERFDGLVAKGDGCWIWRGATGSSGYGYFALGGRNIGAHRVAWLFSFGPIKDGLHVCHRCDNRLCVNPAHLFLGTPVENMQDMIAKGRGPLGERSPNAKLTVKEVLAIRAERNSGGRPHELAGAFGISVTQVRNIWTRKRWKHI